MRSVNLGGMWLLVFPEITLKMQIVPELEAVKLIILLSELLV